MADISDIGRCLVLLRALLCHYMGGKLRRSNAAVEVMLVAASRACRCSLIDFPQRRNRRRVPKPTNVRVGTGTGEVILSMKELGTSPSGFSRRRKRTVAA